MKTTHIAKINIIGAVKNKTRNNQSVGAVASKKMLRRKNNENVPMGADVNYIYEMYY